MIHFFAVYAQNIAIISILISVMGSAYYCYTIYQGKTKPHFFTWSIWAFLSGIAWAAQVHEHAGPGAWVTGAVAANSLLFAALALWIGEKHITRSDWITFCIALMAIPLWHMTNDPFWAVLLVTAIDALAFYPTFRKSWMKPDQEAAGMYVVAIVEFALSMMALHTFNVTTALYPASLIIMNSAFVTLLMVRRRALKG